MNILIVEDNATTSEALAALLRLEGHEVRTLVSGLDVVAGLGQPPPDVVLMDVLLPGVNGMTLLRELRRHPDWDRVPVILMTALNASEVLLQINTERDGPVGLLPKPFEMPALLAALADAQARVTS